jgi:ABC-type nitrate/sulfonate/bicarbonate transport system substrate-binding protein
MATVARRTLGPLLVFAAAVAGAALFFIYSTAKSDAIRLGISPYQDLAMIVNAEPLGLDKKYGTRLELVTMAWEDILPAVASAGRAIDMGFGGYIEYITKYENINAGSSDPILFLYPAYAFKGGTFITYNKEVPKLDRATLEDHRSEAVRRWLGFRIGAQRGSVYEMMLFHLASTHGIDFGNVNVVDTPLDQGFLAAEQGSLDIATAGLTQLTEAERRGAQAVLTMDDLGFADLTGFIVKKSVYEVRRKDVENVVRMWFDSVAYVFADIDRNSKNSLAYLDRNASTRYTLQEYKKALGQEYFPTTLAEAKAQLIDPSGRFSAELIGHAAVQYLVQKGTIKRPVPLPQFPNIAPISN